MKAKQIVRLAEDIPLDLLTFHSLLAKHNLTIEHIAKFLIRLDRLRKSIQRNNNEN